MYFFVCFREVLFRPTQRHMAIRIMTLLNVDRRSISHVKLAHVSL